MIQFNYLSNMISVVILGAGNVAFHLTNEMLNNKEINLIQVYNRSIKPINYLSKKTAITTNIKELKEADIYIISISDDSIEKFSSNLKFKNKLVVHTSGSIEMNQLKSNSNKGVFYPLQTFSKSKKVAFKNIPICIEADNKKNKLLLTTLANLISNKVYSINSKQRKKLHVAAVFVNNFVNYMYKIGHDICIENNIPFEILHPLILETAKKIESLNPEDAQTGPAIRNDVTTIKNHTQLLDKDTKEIYQLLTNSIINSYEKKL